MPRLNLTLTTGLVLQAIAQGHRYGFEIMDVTGHILDEVIKDMKVGGKDKKDGPMDIRRGPKVHTRTIEVA